MPSPCDDIDMIVSKSVAAVEATDRAIWVFRETEGKFELSEEVLIRERSLRIRVLQLFQSLLLVTVTKVWGRENLKLNHVGIFARNNL